MTPMMPACAGRQVVYGATLPQSFQIPAVQLDDGRVVTEWALTEAECELIRRGERVRLELLWTEGASARLRLTITSEHDVS